MKPLDSTPWKRGDKKIAEGLVRKIVSDSPDGPVEGIYGTFLAALLRRHPCADEKIGPGIAFIALGPMPGYKNRGFTLHRADGTSTDFSWRECIYPTPHDRVVRDTLRQAVDDQVHAFKTASQDQVTQLLQCEMTGEMITWDNAEVDHQPPFLELAEDYVQERGGYGVIQLAPSADNQIGRMLLEPDASLWPIYHRLHAQLRILSRAAHREVTRKQQRGGA